jgi:arabinogalactan endo-1,4-beta-galactosidase
MMNSKNRGLVTFWHAHAAVLLITLTFLSTATTTAQIAKGADIGWLSYFENSKGIAYLNDEGQVQDAMEILQGHDMNAIRLRAFVNPTVESIGEVDTEGVVNSAVRANNLGMDVMITIHYSDFWADPGKQYKPAAWEGLTFNELSQAVYDYTYNLMDALLSAGVTPKWVQVGNETNPGFLWEDGRLAQSNGFANMSNFVTLSNMGYSAIKDRSPSTLVITHLAKGNDSTFFQEFFDAFYSHGGMNDVIGMSYYPRWHGGTIQDVSSNMNNLVEQFDKDVMLCEIGHWETEQSLTYNLLVDAIAAVEAVPNGRGLGVFYWEPIAHSSINGFEMGLALPIAEQQYQFSWVLDAFIDGAINCTPTSITPYVQVENGDWEETSSAVASFGGTVKFGPHPLVDMGWSWRGPNDFLATTREVLLTPLDTSYTGYYLATYHPPAGCQADQAFFLDVYEFGELIVENSGFETGALAPWVGVGNYGVDTDLVNSGWYSGWFGGGVSELSQTITGLMPDTTYEFSCYIRNWTGDGGVVTAGVRDFGGTEVTTEVGMTANNGNSFELAKVSFTTGGTNTSAVIYASTSQAHTWGKLDDVRVVYQSLSLSADDISNNEKTGPFNIYPNPASKEVMISAQNYKGEVSVDIYTLQGKKVLHETFNTSYGDPFHLSVSHLAKGGYLIRLTEKSGVITTQKLLIK